MLKPEIQENKVNAMAADALAPGDARSSATMVSTMQDRHCKTSNISRTLEGNKIVDQSDVVGTSPVGTAPTTSSFST